MKINKFCFNIKFSTLIKNITIMEKIFRLKMFSLQHESVFSHAFAFTLLFQVKVKRERKSR